VVCVHPEAPTSSDAGDPLFGLGQMVDGLNQTRASDLVEAKIVPAIGEALHPAGACIALEPARLHDAVRFPPAFRDQRNRPASGRHDGGPTLLLAP